MIKSNNRKLYNRFYHDYISNKSETHDFIDSANHISWDDRIEAIDLNSDRYEKVKQILISQNKDNASKKILEYLDYLQKPECVINITGQQLGLFASPIYTIYKIISTIKLTEELNNRSNKFKFVPVFWLETEDHDFNEINHIGIYNKSFEENQIFYKGNDRGKVSLRHYQLETSITTFLNEVQENLLETEFSEDLFTNLRQFYKPENDWTLSIRSFLEQLFSSYGLLFFNPGDSEIKKISGDFFSQLLSDGLALRKLFEKQSVNLLAFDYHNQVKNITGQTFIHIEQDGKQRAHLYRDDDEFYFKSSERRYSQPEISKLIGKHPSAVSSTVVSRPLLQSWLLPVSAYIAGPGEIAYWAQLGEMFTSMKLRMPTVFPRISATIIEPKISRYLEKYAVDMNDIAVKSEDFISNYFRLKEGREIDNPINKLKQLLDNETVNIESYLQSLDQTLVETGKKTIERMKQSLSNLDNRILKAKEQRDARLTNHLQQIHTSFFPQEMPQERFQSLVYYLNKFGPNFLETLFSNLDHNEFDHQFLYL